MELYVKITGLRSIAQGTGRYEGQCAPAWCGPDGVWRDARLSSEPPAAARVGVYIKGRSEPVYGIARWEVCAELNAGRPVGLWRKMPAHMLLKCAEANALRKAFPETLGGLMVEGERVGRRPMAASVDAMVFEVYRGFLVPAPDGVKPDGSRCMSAEQAAEHVGCSVELVRDMHLKCRGAVPAEV
jgi:hypothetical protein